MSTLSRQPKVAVIDFEMGNLFSVMRACEVSGLQAMISSNPKDLLDAEGVILPGVGAFQGAMQKLQENRCIDAIEKVIQVGKPFMGICLGMQLLLEESHEFGKSKGLGILKGEVLPFESKLPQVKVPQMGWNQIQKRNEWNQTPLQNISDHEYMYFVHSYYCIIKDKNLTLSTTEYAGVQYCSSLMIKNIFACQFHPERSGKAGLLIYEGFSKMLKDG